MSKRTILYIGIAFLVVLGLSWGRIAGKGERFWGETRIACLPSGHQKLELHIHPRLAISVDGALEIVPANIGFSSACMAEIHTHDASGEIHVETVDASRASAFTLADFFAVWGRGYEREGYAASILLNGVPAESPSSFILRDGDRIEISYMSTGA